MKREDFCWAVYPVVLAEQDGTGGIRRYATIWCSDHGDACRIADAEHRRISTPHAAYLVQPPEFELESVSDTVYVKAGATDALHMVRHHLGLAS